MLGLQPSSKTLVNLAYVFLFVIVLIVFQTWKLLFKDKVLNIYLIFVSVFHCWHCYCFFPCESIPFCFRSNFSVKLFENIIDGLKLSSNNWTTFILLLKLALFFLILGREDIFTASIISFKCRARMLFLYGDPQAWIWSFGLYEGLWDQNLALFLLVPLWTEMKSHVYHDLQ